MIKAVIFDMDGVVLDSMGIWQDLGKRFLLSQGRQAKADLNAVLYDMTVEEGAEYMRTEYGLECSVSEILAGLDAIIKDFYYSEVMAKDGIKTLMQYFYEQGIPMAVATSSARDHIEKALERNGLLQYLSGIYTTADVGESKRTPKLYNLVREKLGAAAGDTLVFEDAVFCLETARAAGYKTAGVNDASGGENQETVKALCDYYIESTADISPEEILEFFR